MFQSKRILFLFLSFWISSLHAVMNITEIIIWQCDSHDATEQSFSVFSGSEWSSLRDSMKLCKKESSNPKTCQVSRENCEALVNGQSISPWWQCKAMDSLGYVWIGSFYRVPDNAILGAKARCYTFSAAPATCFTSFFTCKKLNPF